MKRTCLIFISLLLTACGSTLMTPHALSSLERLSGGQVAGDASSLYWAGIRQSRPEFLSERVWMGEYGEYQTEYRWREGQLRELKRTGTALKDDALQPFELHVRYDQHGEAVFQRYKVGESVFPLSDTQLHQLSQQAEQAIAVVKAQSRDGLELMQGVWDGQRFIRCSDHSEHKVDWQHIPVKPGYVAMVAKSDGRGKLTADAVLLSRVSSQQCLTKPVLLDAS
ncbi:DUF1481 domain-containing protein [Photobacterium sp. CCB-ST2H9]|uniref:DUF1481 domain-containing protein n=1 Tax=unclassified Photobacterium TaxID=2628852 RepID=UPI0020059FE8|nr:DUF1481 domain-containing protein [Photobacterium sp. CCB-ST2H9]UTM57166.1 DUF1481 domain-containing protein [Photobacterium sp. CCB-ST2H9]